MYIYICMLCMHIYICVYIILIFMDSYAYKTDYITSFSKILGVTKAWPWTGDPGVHRSQLPRRTRMRFTRRRSDVWTINWSKRNKNLKSYQLLGLGKPRGIRLLWFSHIFPSFPIEKNISESYSNPSGHLLWKENIRNDVSSNCWIQLQLLSVHHGFPSDIRVFFHRRFRKSGGQMGSNWRIMPLSG
jgi:hypothetical protein